MKKILIVCALILVSAVLFAACGKEYKYGMEVVGENGVYHALATDASGNTVLNDEGKAVELITGSDGVPVTDESGEQVTSSLPIPEYFFNSAMNTAEIPELYIKVPEGWSSVGTSDIRLENDDLSLGATLNIGVDDAMTLQEYDTSVRKLGNTISLQSENVSFANDAVNLCGTTAFTYEISNGETGETLVLIGFEADGFFVRCIGSVKTEFRDKVDFNAIVDTVVFR